jgi:hypothetical protein
MTPGFAGRRKDVESALLDYHRAPGKYSLLLRRPAILFASIKEVLLLASGRLPEGEPVPSLAIQRAAGFFVRAALLYPAADHYALLGLDRSADASAVKERYRQMMRLMHPDFATSAAAGGNWPADAAARVNQAYEVLASDAQRRSYDDERNCTAAAAPQRSPGNHSLAHVRASAGAPSSDPRRLLKRMAGAFGVLSALALAAGLLARGPDRESLVQRTTPRTVPSIPAVAQRDLIASQIGMPVDQKPALDETPAVPGAPATMPELGEVQPLPQLAPPNAQPAQLAMASQASAIHRAAPGSATIQPALATPPPSSALPALPPVIAHPVQTPEPAIAVSLQTPAAPAISASAPSVPISQVAATFTAAASTPARGAVIPAVTLAEAHALLAALLQQMESGSGERLLNGLDRNARNAAGAQALARQYTGLVDGARSVKVSNVLLKADPREDRLVVRGQVLLEIGDFAAARSSELSLEAEFAKRNGAIVMTRLAPAQAIGQSSQ